MHHHTYPYAVSRPLDINTVDISGGFWKQIIDRSRTIGLPALLTEYEHRNIVRNFIDVAKGRPRAKEENARNYDEFLFKALEACNYYLGQADTGDLNKQYKRIRDIVLAAQKPDGYLNTLALQTGTLHHSSETVQELYAGGHLMQAGIAEKLVTGKTVLFDAARRYIDCLINGYGLDGSGLGRQWGTWKWPDHPNVEMALVELYRVTGEGKYLEFCDSIWKHAEYRGRIQMTNHAVQELLHATGAADYYLETGDQKVWAATQCLWNDMLKKVYVTGAVGSTHRGPTLESVGKEFGLTNDQAYAETCAAISLVFWSWRMFLATGEGNYVDMLERALYNGVLGGMSLDGCEYFYENPLEYRTVHARGSASLEDQYADFCRDSHERKAFHRCSCCPPNVQRLLASLQQYIYSATNDAVWVNLFMCSQMTLPLQEGKELTLRQETNYPWDGRIEIAIGLQETKAFSLRVRMPTWCAGSSIVVNDRQVSPDVDNGYAVIDRSWTDGDRIMVNLPMPGRLVQSHPKNIANYAKLVMARGPIVYCLEAVDNPDLDLFSLVLPTNRPFEFQYRKDMLDGVVVLEGEALLRDDSEWDRNPYQPFIQDNAIYPAPTSMPVKIVAIPYFARANRGKSSMISALPYVFCKK